MIREMCKTIAAGIRLQFRLALVVPVDFILSTVLQPIFYTVVFLLLLQYAGRLDTLAAFGVIAPAMMGIWATALNVSGEIIDDERSEGILELLIIAPRPGIRFVMLGRVVGVTLVSLFSIVESLLIARLGFGIAITIHQPVAFLGLLVLSGLSISAVALIMASTFVLSRSVRLFQNLLSFPFYVLGGLAFPVDFLPQWLQPVSRAVSLSWAAEGLRQSLTPTPVPLMTFIALVLLTLLYAAIGAMLFTNIERRVRYNGSIGVY